MKRRDILGAGMALTLPAPALAQAFPSRPLKLLVTWPPGGTTDILARQMQPQLSALLGQPVVAENRGGASGAIGATELARSPNDGHVFGMVTSTVISAALLTRQPYDPMRDLAPLQLLARVANIVAVPRNSPIQSLAELIAEAKRRPGAISYGSPGMGSAVHISTELFKLMAGVDMVHVPYRGGGPAVVDLAAGHIPLMFGNASSTLPYVRDGQLRALAVTSAQRAAYLPDVPAIAETLPGFALEEWYACLGPAGIPGPVAQRLSAVLNTVVTTPTERARLLDMGAEVVGSTPEELATFMAQEVEKIGRVVREARIRAD